MKVFVLTIPYSEVLQQHDSLFQQSVMVQWLRVRFPAVISDLVVVRHSSGKFLAKTGLKIPEVRFVFANPAGSLMLYSREDNSLRIEENDDTLSFCLSE